PPVAARLATTTPAAAVLPLAGGDALPDLPVRLVELVDAVDHLDPRAADGGVRRDPSVRLRERHVRLERSAGVGELALGLEDHRDAEERLRARDLLGRAAPLG